jgi:hypothetical protein
LAGALNGQTAQTKIGFQMAMAVLMVDWLLRSRGGGRK